MVLTVPYLEAFDDDRCRRLQAVDLIVDGIIVACRGEEVFAFEEIDAPVKQGEHGYSEKAYFEFTAESQFFHRFFICRFSCPFRSGVSGAWYPSAVTGQF